MEVAAGEVGVREATGRNDGRRIAQYLSTYNLPEGYSWCAAFVNFCLIQCDVNTTGTNAYASSWFPPSKLIYLRSRNVNAEPRDGDVFGIFNYNKRRVVHVGFIEQWTSNDYIVTIEGNSNSGGSYDGDGVYRKKRLKSQIYKVSRWR